MVFFMGWHTISQAKTKTIEAYYFVVNVPQNDVLNIRSSSNYRSKKIGEIPQWETCVWVVISKRVRNKKWWYKVAYKGVDGWVNSRYMERHNHECDSDQDETYDATVHYHSQNATRYKIEFYDNQEKIYAHYFEVKTAPKTTSKTIKTVSTPTVGVVGYVDTKDGRFYITQWSWDRALIGKPSYWVYIPSISPRYSLANVIEEERYSSETQTNSYSNTPIYTKPSVSYSSPMKQKTIVCLGQLTANGFVKKHVKNKVVAFAIEETINAFVTKEISLESVATSAITSFLQEKIKSKLKEKGQPSYANAMDIGKLVFGFAACMGTAG